MTTYAYPRVSTARQDVDNQRHGILEYANTHGLAPVQFVEDAASSRMACELHIHICQAEVRAFLYGQLPPRRSGRQLLPSRMQQSQWQVLAAGILL